MGIREFMGAAASMGHAAAVANSASMTGARADGGMDGRRRSSSGTAFAVRLRRLLGENPSTGKTARVVRRQYRSVAAERGHGQEDAVDEVDAVALYEVEFPCLEGDDVAGEALKAATNQTPVGIDLETDFFGHHAIVKHVRHWSVAAALSKTYLRPGHVVVAVNGQDVSKLGFQDVLVALRAAREPRVIRFLDPEVLPLCELRHERTLVNRDQYGFAKDDEYILQCRRHQRKRKNKSYRHERHWTEFIHRHGGLDVLDQQLRSNAFKAGCEPDEQISLHQELRHLVLAGIPVMLRPRIWTMLARVTPYKAQYPADYFESLVGDKRWEDTLPPVTLSDIDKDVMRTYPEHSFFQTGARGQQELHTVLCAYALHNPAIGYCQAMNFLAGTLVLFMEVEDAFWLLCAMMQPGLLPAANYTPSMTGTQTDQLVFRALVAQELPDLAERLEHCGIQIQLVTLHWFLCAFLCTLPTESALRVWDWFFLDGEEVLFTVSIGILKLAEPAVLAATTHSEVHDIVRSLGVNLHDSDELMMFLNAMNGKPACSSLLDEHGTVVRCDEKVLTERTCSDDNTLVSPTTTHGLVVKLQQLWHLLDDGDSLEKPPYVKTFSMADIDKMRNDIQERLETTTFASLQ